MTSIYFDIYYNEEEKLRIKDSSFVTITGNNSDKIVRDISNKINYLSNVSDGLIVKLFSSTIMKFNTKTVKSEFNHCMNKIYSKEVKNKILGILVEKFNIKDYFNNKISDLNDSEKIFIKFVIAFSLNPKIIIIDNLINEMDLIYRKQIIEYLKKMKELNKIIINITKNINESVYSDRLIIINNYKKMIDEKIKTAFKKDVLIKESGYHIPFIFDLNNYLKDYELIDKYILDYERLIKYLWK